MSLAHYVSNAFKSVLVAFGALILIIFGIWIIFKGAANKSILLYIVGIIIIFVTALTATYLSAKYRVHLHAGTTYVTRQRHY